MRIGASFFCLYAHAERNRNAFETWVKEGRARKNCKMFGLSLVFS